MESKLNSDKKQITKSGLYFGGNVTPMKFLSMEDMMKAVVL